MQPRAPLFLSLSLLLLPACAVEDDEYDLRSGDLTGSNSSGGTVFNTNYIEGGNFSELAQPMGAEHLGVALEAVTLHDDTPISSFEVTKEGQLIAWDDAQVAHVGTELKHSVWTIGWGVWKAVGMVDMRLTGFTTIDGQQHYSFEHDGGGTPTRTCPDAAADKPGWARVLAGFTIHEPTGDVTPAPNVLYLACTTGATGKAATLGYYDTDVDDDDLDALGILELAIRAVRADYCYDGVSHTKPGVPVSFEDDWGVNPSKTGTIEAVWGADRLLCRGQGRQTPIACDKKFIPTCAPDTTLKDYPDGKILTRVK